MDSKDNAISTEPMGVYNFKAPIELEEALFNVVKKTNTIDKRVTKSSFICDIVLKNPLIAAELKKIISAKKRRTSVTT